MIRWTLQITFTPSTTVDASAACQNENLRVSITAGEVNFDITGNGPDLSPLDRTGGDYVFSGPGSWTNVSVTGLEGDEQTAPLQNQNSTPVPPEVKEGTEAKEENRFSNRR